MSKLVILIDFFIYFIINFSKDIYILFTTTPSVNFNSIAIVFIVVVAQFYDSDVNKAYAILGNSVIMKCETPSYVADFVTVISWHTDNGDLYYPGNNYGITI